MKVYLFLVFVISMLTFYCLGQGSPASYFLNNLNGVYSSEDCDFEFKISCSGYSLKNGKYKCWYSTDLGCNRWEGTYMIDWANMRITFTPDNKDPEVFDLKTDGTKFSFGWYYSGLHNHHWFRSVYRKIRCK